jgi:hypothetical protein
MTPTPESPSRIYTSVHTSAIVNGTLINAAFAFGLVFPLATIIDSITDLVEPDTHSAAAIKFCFRVTTLRDCAYFFVKIDQLLLNSRK